ncbi:MAG: WHG domain-containing protein, partial [Comamonadaceae bacterium]
RAGLRAVGRGYLRFAEREPGLFRTAFSAREDVAPASGEPMAPVDDPHPFQLLGAALDRMAEVGLLPAERRPGAEFLAWSAVHGLAMLVLEGPLRRLTEAQREQAGHRLIDMVEKGL